MIDGAAMSASRSSNSYHKLIHTKQMIIFVAILFLLFASGTVVSGWLLYKLAQVDIEPRCYQMQHRFDNIKC